MLLLLSLFHFLPWFSFLDLVLKFCWHVAMPAHLSLSFLPLTLSVSLPCHPHLLCCKKMQLSKGFYLQPFSHVCCKLCLYGCRGSTSFDFLSRHATHANGRGSTLSSLLQLHITVRFYGALTFQPGAGDLVNVFQSSVCHTIGTISGMIAATLYPHLSA